MCHPPQFFGGNGKGSVSPFTRDGFDKLTLPDLRKPPGDFMPLPYSIQQMH